MSNLKSLYDIVINNNYHKLNNIIKTNTKIFKNVKSNCTILYRAIQYRSKECFDILLNEYRNIMNEEELVEKIYAYNGIYMAILYFINGNNESNLYYIEKLSEYDYNFYISNEISYIVNKHNINNFVLLLNFNNIKFSNRLLYNIYNNTLDKTIYNYLINNNIEYNIIKKLFMDNLSFFNKFNKEHYNYYMNTYPTIWKDTQCLKYIIDKDIFKDIYQKFLSLSKDELNTIYSSKYLYDMCYVPENINVTLNIINFLKLPFQFDINKYLMSYISYCADNINIEDKSINFILLIIYYIINRNDFNIIDDIYLYLKNKADKYSYNLNILENIKKISYIFSKSGQPFKEDIISNNIVIDTEQIDNLIFQLFN
jgi:hypothetical protein